MAPDNQKKLSVFTSLPLGVSDLVIAGHSEFASNPYGRVFTFPLVHYVHLVTQHDLQHAPCNGVITSSISDYVRNQKWLQLFQIITLKDIRPIVIRGARDCLDMGMIFLGGISECCTRLFIWKVTEIFLQNLNLCLSLRSRLIGCQGTVLYTASSKGVWWPCLLVVSACTLLVSFFISVSFSSFLYNFSKNNCILAVLWKASWEIISSADNFTASPSVCLL